MRFRNRIDPTEMTTENPNLEDLPPGQTVDEVDSRVRERNDQQVMGAQIAAAAAAPQMVNGTYGAIGTSGPLSMDGEVLAAPQRTDAQRTGDVGVAGRGSGDTGIGTLKAAAERVMANVAAKVQGVLPPQGRGSSAQGFLQREDTGSAGTHGTGFLTAGSGMPGEQSTPEAQGTSGSGLFSPQQAQRLREMSSEAPLLYAGEGRPVPQRGGAEERQVPPLPHSSSSDSGQAEAIQAEVRKQMQVFMEAQSELQRRVVSLSEENQMLRQVANVSELTSEGFGPHEGRGGWFSGLRRNIMGLVQQAPGKAPPMPFVVEGWQTVQGHSSLPPAPPLQAGCLPGPIPAGPAAPMHPPLPIGYGLGPTPVTPTVPVSKASDNQGYSVRLEASQPAATVSSGLGPCGYPSNPTAPVAPEHAGPAANASSSGPTGHSPLEAMMSGIVQLQNVVADLATSRAGAAVSTSGGNPEVVRPGVTELVKLPPPTLEGALGFSDWLHAIKPSMSDLSDSSGECWQRVLGQAQEWYTSQYVPSGPVARVRLKPPASEVDKEPRWNRVRHRMEHLILQSCPDAVRAELSSARVSGVLPIMCRLYTVYKPGGVTERAEALRQVQQPRPADSPIDAVMKLRTWKRWMTRLSDLGGTQPDAAVSIQALEGITSGVLKGLPSLSFRVNLVRASLHLDTQPSAGKVEEFFEHLLAELEGVSRVAEPSSGSAAGGGKPDSSKSVRQVEAKAALSGGSEAPQVAQKDKPTKPPTPSGGESPKKPCKWFMEGKGCRRGKDCRFLHDWNQIPKAEKGDRCMLCGGKGHRKDACTVVTGAPLVKRDDGASSAKAMRSDASPKSKGGDPGLRKVLSDAAGVLREAMAVGSAPGDGAVQGAGGTGQASGAEGSEAPTMAVAAKIQAQLEDLEARVLDGGPSIRSVCGNVSEGAGEPTALLDSGATHVVVDDAAAGSQDLVPCTVSLAGDQRQTWHQTPGGSLVAPVTGDGHAPQTILPLGSLVTQLGCSLRWSKREGLQLMHPKLGRLKTSLKGGCPQLSKDQALSLIRELEGVRLGELAGRLKRIQAHLKVSKGLGFRDALDAFVESGSYTSAWTLSKMMPFLEQVPAALVARLVVDLEGANGWELLKGLPFNRRSRKRLHQSHLWLLHLGAGKVDPVLRQMCQMQGVEVVAINLADGSAVDPRVWKALSWAAFTGRLAGIVADAPMRTWNGVRVDDSAAVHLRTSEHPWGLTSNTTAWQSKVEDDTVFSLQPMWLWTIASISKGQGVPFIQTHAVSAPNPNSSWMSSVVNPFTTWSNCSQFQVHEAKEAKGNTRPMVVCSNLGFGENGVRNGSSNEKVAAAPCVPGWSSALRREVTMALFGPNPSNRGGADVETPHVSALDAQLSQVPASSSSPQEEPPPGMEALSPVNEESESSPLPPPVGEKGEGPVPVPERSRPVSKTIAEKDKERWRRHLAAHHVPYRKDCLKCVTAGALGLQHRRVKCPSMYALAFDLAGPFKERGKDEKGGGYKYVLVAGLRVPDIALPGDEVQKPTANSSRPEVSDGGPKQPGIDDDEGSEVSWLNANLEPTAGVMHVSQPDSDTEEDQESIVSWVEMPDLEGLPEPDDEGELDQVEAEPEGVPEGHRAPELEGDLWEDTLGVADMSDEQFDDALSQLLFKGANKVLRFAVPVKSRKGPQILAALQEVVTECNRLGFPVKIAHTDRAKELMSKATVEWLQSKLIQPSFTQGDDPQSNGLAERLVGWVKARARLHLAASGLGVEQWPAAMSFACAEHRNRMLQVDTKLPRFGQKVVFKSKHPTGRSKRPFIRWEHAVYLCPTPRTEGGHVLQRALSGAYLVAKNVRCIENLVDPEAELGDETVVEVDAPDELPRASEDGQPSAPSRRITGKRAVRAISLPAETTARDFLRNGWFTPDHCGRLLEMAFGGTEAISRRTHRGPMELAVVLGAYGHGGLHGVTRASRVYPEVCRYLNEYLRRNLPPGQSHPQWSALTVVVAPEVAVHRDVRNEPGSVNYVTQVTTRSMWIEGATEAGLEQMCADEKGIERKGYWMPLTQVTSTFDPKQRHSVLPATNWVLAGYTPLGSCKLPPAKQNELRELGFNVPGAVMPTVCKLVGPCPHRLPEARPRRHPPPRRAGLNVRYARMSGSEWAELRQLDEEQFEMRMARWSRVLGGADEDPNMDPVSASIPHNLLVSHVFQGRN